MHTFWVESFLEEEAVLSSADAHHALHVLRLQPDTRVGGVDGHGLYVKGSLQQVGKDRASIRIDQRIANWGEPPVGTTLCFSLLKNRERVEWLLEKATELGVTRLVPLQADRSERTQFNADRAHRILVAVLKQNHRSRLPELWQPMPVPEALPRLDGPHVVGFCEATLPLHTVAANLVGQHVTYWIGPEGDFSASEIQALQAAGASIVSFGQTRLRAETAALFAMSWHKALQGY